MAEKSDFFDQIANVELTELSKEDGSNGEKCTLESLYGEKPIVLRLFRRSGWQWTRGEAAVLAQIQPKLEELGVELIGVFGTDLGAAEFVQTNIWPGRAFLANDYALHKALGAQAQKAGGLVDLMKVWKYPKLGRLNKALKAELGGSIPKGNMNGSDPFLGGTFVFGPGPKTSYTHLQGFFIDTPKNEDILEAAEKAVKG